MPNTKIDRCSMTWAIHRALNGEIRRERCTGARCRHRDAGAVLARSPIWTMARAIPLIARMCHRSRSCRCSHDRDRAELDLELGVPGIEPGDVDVAISDGWLTVAGARSGAPATTRYLHVDAARALPREVQLRADEWSATRRGGEVHRSVRIAKQPSRRRRALVPSIPTKQRVDHGDGVVRRQGSCTAWMTPFAPPSRPSAARHS